MKRHNFKCGAGKADITPEIGTILYGYAPGRPAESVGDHLEAVAILPSPFETFAEIGLRIRSLSPYPYTLNLCNTHGSYAYLPTKNDIPSGGYEVWHFLLAMRTTYPLPCNTDDYWVKQNVEILRNPQ